MALTDIQILIVEDEPKVGAFLLEGLQEHGYFPVLVCDGDSGQKRFEQGTFQLVILDVLMPGISGLELCKRIREKDPQVPILILTALGTTIDKLKGFDSGADDYLIKPFEFSELLARVKALTRRFAGSFETGDILYAFDLELDLERKKFKRGDKVLSLTAKEMKLLEFLIRNKDRVVSKEEIAEKVWGLTFDTGTNFVEVYINLLRKKIDKDSPSKLIHTRVGLGYCLTDSP
jgi:two-component system copper resistance phosphate regulon response regulator CusR